MDNANVGKYRVYECFWPLSLSLIHIYGDDKYGEKTAPGQPDLLALCAFRLSFPHPVTGKRMEFEMEDVYKRQEFDILYLLASNPGKVFSTDEIFERVWNEKVYEANNTVMVHIRRLRGKMKEDTRQSKIITTVWGVGYKIEK